MLDCLRARYAALNQEWFDGALPEVSFRVSSRMTTTAGQYDLSKGEIAVAARFVDAFPDRVDALLLHEMVHVATRAGHGPRFRAEWQRLRDASAPVSISYAEFRHCPEFASPQPRPYEYLCPVCGGSFARTRPFRGARWCGSCVNRARREGGDPFSSERRLFRRGA